MIWPNRALFAATVILLSAPMEAAAQTPFNVKSGGAQTDASDGTRTRAAIVEIENIAAKAGPEQEAVESVFMLSQGAIKRLARIGASAILDIKNVLADPAKDWKAKAMMCEALGGINDVGSAALLEQILQDSGQHEFVRAVAGHALAAMGRPDSARVIERIVSSKNTPSKIRARTMMAVGATGLDDVDWLKRAALGEGIEFHAGKELSQEQAQEEAGIILNAQRALGTSNNPKALDALIELQDQHPTNSILAEILARKKDPRSVPVLLKVLTYQSPGRRGSLTPGYAATALGDMKAAQALEPLIRIVEKDSDELLVGRAALALANIGDKRAIEPIKNVVAHMHSDQRFTYAGDSYFAQEKIGGGPLPMLKKALDQLTKK
mgnify:CR=1 FL=1